MKIFFFILKIILTINFIEELEQTNLEIRYVDGINKLLLDNKLPQVHLIGKNKFEISNFCKNLECKSEFQNDVNYFNCLLKTKYECDSNSENQSIYKIEEILYNSDFIEKLELDGSTYEYISTSKNEEGILLIKDN